MTVPQPREGRAEVSLGDQFFEHFEKSETKGAVLMFLRGMATLQPKREN